MGGALCSVCLTDNECKFLSDSGVLPGLNKCQKLPARSKCVECIKNEDCPSERPYCNDFFGKCDECRRNNDCLKGYICDIQMINGEPVYDKPRKCFLGNCKFDEDCIKIGKNTCVDHKCE